METSIFSFFSGSGFLDLGFEDIGHDVVFVNEFHKPFLDAYKHSRHKLGRKLPKYGHHQCSIEDFLTENGHAELRNFIKKEKRDKKITGFIGGPPCPDFSVGGKNRGKTGENGRLSGSYAQLICENKPDFFLFENVKGLWRTKKHRAFYESLKEKFNEAGYVLHEKLINSIDYGVPQDRERIILIGFHKSQTVSNAHYFDWSQGVIYQNKSAFTYKWPDVTPYIPEQPLKKPRGVPAELTLEHWFQKNKVDLHPNATHCFKAKAGLVKFEKVLEGDVSKKSYKRPHRWRYSPTACYGNNEVHLHPYKPRRMTVAETLAIQSLPASFELPADMTLTNMFKTIGNGVPYLAAKGIATSISSYLRALYGITDSYKLSQCNSKLTA